MTTLADTTHGYSPISSSVLPTEIYSTRQAVRQQTDGVGLRTGSKAEFTLVAPVKPGGAELFRQHAVKAQIEAPYWEGKLGTVHDLRICLINDDTQILLAATYSDEFKPYVADVITFAAPWIDYLFTDVAEGYPGITSPEVMLYFQKHTVQAALWYASNADATVRDVARGQRVLRAFDDLLDAAQS
jgi:hypothetical protein